MRVRLCDADRTAFGVVAEWVELDVEAVTCAEMEELAGRFGFEPAEWPAPLFGAATLAGLADPAGLRPPRWQSWATAWLLLRQAGVDASWEDAGRVRYFKARVARPEAAEVAETPARPPRRRRKPATDG